MKKKEKGFLLTATNGLSNFQEKEGRPRGEVGRIEKGRRRIASGDWETADFSRGGLLYVQEFSKPNAPRRRVLSDGVRVWPFFSTN